MRQKLLQSGGAQMVKLEGPHFDVVSFLVKLGVPVCGHLGLLPQSINQLGSYKVQGKDSTEATKMLADALQLQAAGASMLVLECVPADLAKEITSQLSIPVIGIGAGVDCDGQVLVLYDMLDVGVGKRPRFSKTLCKVLLRFLMQFLPITLLLRVSSFQALNILFKHYANF